MFSCMNTYQGKILIIYGYQKGGIQQLGRKNDNYAKMLVSYWVVIITYEKKKVLR